MHALIASVVLFSSFGTLPMTVYTQKGHTFRGALTVSIPVTFQFSDGRLTCYGKFSPIIPAGGNGGSVAYTVPLACSRGVRGIATFSDALSSNGGGSLQLSDGTAGSFIYGDGAAGL